MAYRRVSRMAEPVFSHVIQRRLKRGKEDPDRVHERRGVASLERPPGPLIWIHGASVGEVLAAAGLIERLRALNVRILLTSGTVTSAAIAARRFPPDVMHQYVPFDSPKYVNEFLDYWQPGLALFVESDLWPNLMLSSVERRIPMVLVNGRMSQRSFPRWRRAYGTISALLDCFDLCLVQSELDGDRFTALGSQNVTVAGNLKLDVPAPPADPRRLARLRSATQRRVVMVAASTHAGEEEIVLDAHKRLVGHFPTLLSVIVPRHPQRGLAIAQMLASSGFQVALRSHDQLPTGNTDIYVADTMGELGLFYRIASVVFMGGSLVEHGGQNPIEAIKLGVSVLHGPHTFNFSEIYQTLNSAGGAIKAHTDEDFIRSLGHLLSDPVARQRTVDAGAKVVARLGGALERTFAALEPYLLQIRLEQNA
jgi:3-deoxy-D-manno-octulosonic-acid transferase